MFYLLEGDYICGWRQGAKGDNEVISGHMGLRESWGLEGLGLRASILELRMQVSALRLESGQKFPGLCVVKLIRWIGEQEPVIYVTGWASPISL